MAPSVVFHSKIDTWLAVIIIGAALVAAAAVVIVGMKQSAMAALALSPVLLIGAALPLWLLKATHYTLDATDLHVRSGPFKWRVPLREIRSITPTRNPLSSPALSLDRLRIEYGRGGWIMISPADKEGFLKELERRRKVAAAVQ